MRPVLRHLTHWLLLEVLFATIPLIAFAFISFLSGKEAIVSTQNIPEILFFCILLAATTIRDLFEHYGVPSQSEILPTSLLVLIIFAVVLASILYGAYLFVTINGLDKAVFLAKMLVSATAIAAACAFLAFAAQFNIARKNLP